MKIKLTQNDLILADTVGRRRNRSQRDGDRADGKVMKDSLAIDIQGAESELAVAKALNLPWDGKFLELKKWFDWRNNGHDVSGLEVRSTHHPKGKLILHPKDKDEAPFILVLTNERPIFNLVGWNFGRVGKMQRYWRDVGYGRPCYYLPQSDLLPMSRIPRCDERKGFSAPLAPAFSGLDKIEFGHCVHCNGVTIMPQSDECECGYELYPVTKSLDKGRTIKALEEMKGW